MKIRLLIADDHEVLRLGLHSVLTDSVGMEIVGEAKDGASAVTACLEHNPDVVLMDIRMPKLDGIEATKQVKSQCGHVKVLILTSNDNREDMFAALAAGADGYCLKDVPSNQLILAIQTVCSGSTWLDPQIAKVVLRSALSGGPGALDSPGENAQSTPEFALSARELDILRLLVEGLSNLEMANKLSIAPDTVKSHMRRILEKLEVSDRTQAAIKAMRKGLV